MKRLPFDSELKVHHLSRQDLNFFVSTFVQCRFPYNIKTDEYPDWVTRSFYGKHATLDDYAIARHLTGKHLVAVFPGSYTKYLVLDIDQSGYQKEILKAVLQILPDPLVIQSSATKGIHVYYFFDPVIRVDKLEKLMGTILNTHEVPVRPGYCEVFPQMKRALRLPLGKGSYVVDPQTLDPIHRNAADGIRFIKENIIYHSIDKVLPYGESGDELIKCDSVPYKPTRNTVELPVETGIATSKRHLNPLTDPSDKFTGREFHDLIDGLLREGIQRPGTRYVLQSKLIFHFWSLGYSREKCYEVISQWYLSHNHQSKNWQANPGKVFRQLKGAITSFYRNGERKGYQSRSMRRGTLTVPDVQNIIQMTPNYRMQKFLFSLLTYACNARDSLGEFWLPKNAIVKFDACSNTSYQEKMSFCESIGLITMVKEHSIKEHRARTYRTNYVFSEGEQTVESLEEGLRKIFNPQELSERYGRYYLLRILSGRE